MRKVGKRNRTISGVLKRQRKSELQIWDHQAATAVVGGDSEITRDQKELIKKKKTPAWACVAYDKEWRKKNE